MSEDERGFVKAMYPGVAWHQKVERMSDAQIHAIYMRAMDETTPKKPEQDSKEEF